MNFDYSEMLKELDRRRFGTTDAQMILNESRTLRDDRAAFESFNYSRQYQDLKEDDLVKYLIGAMLPVSQNYTQQIISSRTRVEHVLAQMNKNIYQSAPISFQYQGSVSNNTHLGRYSDVDLLVMIGIYETLEPPLKPAIPYSGNPNNDLLNLRNHCVQQISRDMSSVTIDDNGAKSIALKGGSLAVKVDVVPANWYNTVKYTNTDNKTYRGIQIYNKKKNERIVNYPFLFNELLRQKDARTGGVFKQAVRLLKTIKADIERLSAKKVNLSSYAISSLLYSVEDSRFFIGTSPLTLVRVLNQILSYYSDEDNFNSLTDPIGQPLNNSESVEGVRSLQSATQKILNDIADITKRIIIAA